MGCAVTSPPSPRLLSTLREEGYDLGNLPGGEVDGEAIVRALQAQEEGRTVALGKRGIENK